MAPSRGSRGFVQMLRIPIEARSTVGFSRRAYSSFAERLSNPANRVQSYLSRSDDPFLNLSIEDYILRNSPPDSTVLFLYTNRPCAVIGRNQNPWKEVNLGILDVSSQDRSKRFRGTEPPAIGDVDLVRRRSGGGAVFHDEGNVNWSVTCPLSDFTRDKHAELVVRALRYLGVDRARVNERHDIVLDQGDRKSIVDPKDMHKTAYTIDDSTAPRPLKVSGSAYKLTRGRALHHATALLRSPNLHIIPQYLRSPAKPYINAKGVESVSSPVSNIGLENEAFQRHLRQEFATMYGSGKEIMADIVCEEHLSIPDIKKGYDELRTNDWILSQTPQFTFKVDPSNPAHDVGIHIEMTVHHGTIKTFEFGSVTASVVAVEKARSLLVGRRLQDIHNWHGFLRSNIPGEISATTEIADILEEYLPIPEAPYSREKFGSGRKSVERAGIYTIAEGALTPDKEEGALQQGR